MDRRRFLHTSLLAAASATTNSWASTASSQSITVHLEPRRVLGVVPVEFTGLGFEASAVARSGFLSAENTAYIQYTKTLGERGVIRIGGNVSDFTHWSPNGQPSALPKATVLNEHCIRELGEFLRSLGWRLIWGLNLGNGTTAEAVAEAQSVASAAGDLLLAFEIGNEPDLFAHSEHRSPGWDYAEWYRQYVQFRSAIESKLPNAPFAGPDVANATEWVSRFAAAEQTRIKLLTHHYYAEGPPDSPRSTIDNLLRTDPKLTRILTQLKDASTACKVPYRICETNSCFGGGKPGVGDTFASALWGLDFMLTLCAADCSGVNVETSINQLGFLSSYSPVWEDGRGNYSARPLYYGMLAFQQVAQGQRIAAEYAAGETNMKAYAFKDKDQLLRVVLINKEPSTDIEISLMSPGKLAHASAMRLRAPSLESKSGMTLGDTEVLASGSWLPGRPETLALRGSECIAHLPSASAAIVHLQA